MFRVRPSSTTRSLYRTTIPLAVKMDMAAKGALYSRWGKGEAQLPASGEHLCGRRVFCFETLMWFVYLTLLAALGYLGLKIWRVETEHPFRNPRGLPPAAGQEAAPRFRSSGATHVKRYAAC